MNSLKRKNMMAAYTGFRGTQTLTAVLAQLPADLTARLTGAELGQVAGLLYEVYNKGRSSTQASIEDDCVWVGAGVDRLVPLTIIRALPANIHLA